MRETSQHRNSGGLSLETTPVENSQRSGQTPSREVQCNCSYLGTWDELGEGDHQQEVASIYFVDNRANSFTM